MPIDLYYYALSGPCRAVALTAKMVGVEINLKTVDLMAREQMKPEFLKINPTHTVPTLDDGGFYLYESRAICAYLVNKYGRNDKLYPKLPKERALVDQRLYFDMGVFYQSFANYYVSIELLKKFSCWLNEYKHTFIQYPVMWHGATSLDDSKKAALDNAIGFLNTYLSETDYAAGDHMTIADLSLLASATSMEAVVGTIFDDYPHIKEWLARCKSEIDDYQQLNQVGADIFGQVGQAALAKISS